MRVSISGTSITGYDDTRVTSDTEVDFPGNPAAYPDFPHGYTVTGTAGSRVLNQPAFGNNAAQVVATEITVYTGPDQATQAELDTAQAGDQPLDSDLTAIAALTTTAFGRGLLDDATAAAVRTTLGLGTAAVTDSTAYVRQSANSIAIIGTSISNFNLETSTIRKDHSTAGYFTWAQMELGCPFRLVVCDGQAGTTAADMATRFATTVLPYAPSTLIIEPGPNDITQNAAITPATVKASILSIITQAEAMGAKRLLLCSITPASGWTTTQKNTGADVNNWMRIFAELHPSTAEIIYVDWYPAVIDPTTDAWFSTCSTDGTHPKTQGARRMGGVLADAIRKAGYANIARLANAAATVDLGLISLNPRFIGTTGSAGTGQTGTTPTSWSMVRSPSGEAATFTTSQVNRSTLAMPPYYSYDTVDWVDGTVFKIDPTGGSGGRGVVIFQTPTVAGTGKFAAADGFLYVPRFEVVYLDPAYTTITKLEVKLEFQDSGGGALAQSYSSFLGSSAGNWPTEHKMSRFVLEGPPITPPALTTKAFVGLYYDGDAPIHIDRGGFRRLLDLTTAAA